MGLSHDDPLVGIKAVIYGQGPSLTAALHHLLANEL